MGRPSISVIVTSYNSPATLRLVLLGLLRQTVLPAEALVTDDGSEHGTAEMLEQLAPHLPFPLIHLWQPHEGFRAARSRNNGIFRARGDLLAFLDQDTVPHARWLDIHTADLAAREVSLGDAIQIGSGEGAVLTEQAVRTGRFERIISFGERRRLFCLHARYGLYAALRSHGVRIKDKPRLRSCNFAAPAAVLREVNGFDESYVGWGQEDDDLGRRFYKLGVRPRVRVLQARVSHIPHPPRRPAEWSAGENARRFVESAGSSPRCEAGLSRHPYADVRVRVLSS